MGLLIRIYPQAGIGQPFEISGRTLSVGRDNADISLSDDSVSRRHATIAWNGTTHVVTDLSSTNGTYVNEKRITEHGLTVGDRIRFGNQLLKYLAQGSMESQYHESVFKLMTTDGLTQVHNKIYFLECFQRELHLAQRSGSPLCIMLIDLDHFKSVNDTYGHLAGDRALAELASRAQAVTRRGDLLARYGGEEFALMCARSTLEEATMTAQRVRQAIAASPVRFDTCSIAMTVSIGIAEFSVCKSSEPTYFDAEALATVLLAEADQWLYAAKRNGRNQVASCLQNLSHARLATDCGASSSPSPLTLM